VSRGAVHDDIDLAELLDRLRNCLLDFLWLPHITGNCNRLPTLLINCLRSRFQVVQLATYERHGSTRFCKRTRDSTRDPRPTASDERHASIQNSFIKDFFTHIKTLIPSLSMSGYPRKSAAKIASSNVN